MAPPYNPSQNSLVEICLVSLTLGAVMGASLTLLLTRFECAFVASSKLCIYFLLLSVHFTSEFLATYWYTGRATSRSFVVYGHRGTAEFWVLQAISVAEWYWHGANSPWCAVLGSAMAVSGLVLRHMSIRDCGTSFSHYIERKRAKLVTNGVYGFSRHPSYLGFWLFGVGMEVLLGNVVMLVVVVVVLGYFFGKRVRYEEGLLVRMYGEYGEYRGRVGVWIPMW